MSQNYFEQRKDSVLSKADKSSIGCWDQKIVSLCKKVNLLKDCYTTSSCSGRIVLMYDKEKKGKGLFLKVYHEAITFNKLKKSLLEIHSDQLIKFKQEPCILHVACRDLEISQDLLRKAQLAGWKKSGIISSGDRFIVELSGTEKIEFPIMNHGKILVDDTFLKLVVNKANRNLKASWEKMAKLGHALKVK